MDFDGSAEVVAKGTVAFTIFGSLSASGFALAKGQRPLPYALSTGLNSGVAALTFFGSREYIVRPLVGEFGQSDGRSHDLLGSAFAGTITGAFLNGIRYGPTRVPSGALAWAATASVLQLGYNQVSAFAVRRAAANAALPVSTTPKGGISDSVMTVMTYVAPVKKLTDEEYVDVMKKKQAAIEKRLGQLDDDASKSKEA